MSDLSWIDKIYLINLDRSKDRLEKCMRQAQKYNLDIERFPAIEGSKLTEEQKKDVHPICKYLLCTNGMMGCALSHYYILKKIVEEEIDTTLVLEDDFIWREDTISKLEKIKDFDKGIVKLSCFGPFCKSDPTILDEPQVSPFSFGNGAYLVRYKNAKEFIDKIDRIVYHIDFQMSTISKYYSIPIYFYDCIDIDGINDSTIGTQKGTFLIRYLPLSNEVKWMLSEPFMAPFGKPLHLFIFISVLLIILGIITYRVNEDGVNKWIGVILIGLGIFDILYYILN